MNKKRKKERKKKEKKILITHNSRSKFIRGYKKRNRRIEKQAKEGTNYCICNFIAF